VYEEDAVASSFDHVAMEVEMEAVLASVDEVLHVDAYEVRDVDVNDYEDDADALEEVDD
jgi:hypothetical protein